MAMSLNRFECIGRVGQVKMATLADGTPVAELSVAIDESYKKDGELQKKTEWVTVKAYRQQAEFIERFCLKGNRVLVQGKLATRQWEKDGQKHYATEILVSSPGMGVTPIDWPTTEDSGNTSTHHQARQNAPRTASDPRGNAAQGRGGQNANQGHPRANGGGVSRPTGGSKSPDLGPAFPSASTGMDDVPF